MRAPWVGRPQAARLQPVVRKAGMRNAKKPKGGASKQAGAHIQSS